MESSSTSKQTSADRVMLIISGVFGVIMLVEAGLFFTRNKDKTLATVTLCLGIIVIGASALMTTDRTESTKKQHYFAMAVLTMSICSALVGGFSLFGMKSLMTNIEKAKKDQE